MGADAIAYDASHRAEMAGTKTIHLLPKNITADMLAHIRRRGLTVRAGPTNDVALLRKMAELGIRRVCTDDLERALEIRAQLARENRPSDHP